ncbi:MAG: transcription factor [Candidatus Lokiarchaeota archaeon]|nr:transcription factor [Candidatus Harpocratesius repetitus]
MLLDAGDETTDEKIAELSKVKLNVVRKILYILNENKLTEFKRVRDKRSGWFVYFWNESFDNLPLLLQERREMVIEKLESRMKYEEQNYFFQCSNGCEGRYVFIEAMDYNFICPVCQQGQLVADENKKKVQFLKDSIIKLRNL